MCDDQSNLAFTPLCRALSGQCKQSGSLMKGHGKSWKICVSQRKLARKQNTGIPTRKLAPWLLKWCARGNVSNSSRACEMKDLLDTAHLKLHCFELKQKQLNHQLRFSIPAGAVRCCRVVGALVRSFSGSCWCCDGPSAVRLSPLKLTL